MTRTRQRISRTITMALVAIAASGCRASAMHPCTGLRMAAPLAPSSQMTLRFDYAGAEAMIAALERDALSDAAVDSLLGIHGVRMTVDNVTRFIPELGRDDFRAAIQRFVRSGRIAREHAPFNLRKAKSERGRVRALISEIRGNERAVLQRTLGVLAPYSPETGPLHLTAYLIAGGTSTGFVPETPRGTAFYANLADLEGDCEGVIWLVAHEIYHLVQKAALRRMPGLVRFADSVESLPVAERLLFTALFEGTASLVSDPDRFGGDGPEISRQRERYRLDAEPARVRENFAIFDTLYQRAVRNEVAWRVVQDRGFMNNARFYALGRQMAQAIERHCEEKEGPACIRKQFARPPVEFFREYIRLYRTHPEIVGRFALETERLLGAGR